MKKYEIKEEGIDIDVYVPYFSDLGISIDRILSSTITIEGIKVPKPEVLLLLKLRAFTARAQSIKGKKDAIDIVNLLYAVEIDVKKLCDLGGGQTANNLRGLISAFSEVEYTPMDWREFIKFKRDMLKKLKC